MTSEAPPKHSAATVGSTFMRQYYHLLAKDPQSLHRFYKDESVWCHGVGATMQAPVAGQQAIHDEILRRGYAGAHVDLDIGSIDCQDSLGSGVFVLVTGLMTLAADPAVARPFVQTFFLAVQPRGYFVLNDCLRFLELPTPSAKPSPLPKPTTEVVPAAKSEGTKPTSPTPAPAVASPKKAPAPAPVAKPVPAPTPVSPKAKTATPKAKEVAPVSPPKESESPVAVKSVASPVKAAPASPVKPKAVSPTPKSPIATPEAVSPVKKAVSPAPTEKKKPAVAKPPSPVKVVEKKAAEPVPAAPRTWAALFAAKGDAPAATPTAVAVAPTQPVKPVKPVASVAATVTVTVTATPTPTPATAPAPAPASPMAKPAEAPASASHERKQRNLFTLYIRDIPTQTKEADVRGLFEPFGVVASVTVSGPRGYAFVDYVEEASMRAALAQATEFKLYDKVLHVDERREKERGGFRSDFRGRGRGHGPRGGRMGERGRGDREGMNNANGRTAPTTGSAPSGNGSGTGPRPTGDRRDKGGRRGGAKEGQARTE